MSTPQQQSSDPVSSERGEDELDAKLEEQFSNFMEQVEEWQSNIAGMPSERDMMLLDEIYAARIAATKQLLAPSSTSPIGRGQIVTPLSPVGGKTPRRVTQGMTPQNAELLKKIDMAIYRSHPDSTDPHFDETIP